MTKARQGWGWPGGARKAHYFTVGGRSLCGGWLFTGIVYDTNDNSSDNCKECKRRVMKRRLQSKE